MEARAGYPDADIGTECCSRCEMKSSCLRPGEVGVSSSFSFSFFFFFCLSVMVLVAGMFNCFGRMGVRMGIRFIAMERKEAVGVPTTPAQD